MRIINLDPDTLYDIYCYTEDYDNRVMALDDAQAAVVSGVRTECCREISFSSGVATQIKYIQDSVIPELPFVVQLDSRPTDETVVSVIYTEVTCDIYKKPIKFPKARVSISPNNFTFNSESSFLQGSFLVRSYDQVCLVLDVKSIGPDYYTPAKWNLTVTGYNVPPLPPTVTKVQMADNGRSLQMNFDKGTDKGMTKIAAYSASFPCDLLLVMTSANTSMCKWPSDTELNIQFDDDFFCSQGENWRLCFFEGKYSEESLPRHIGLL
jgi:hypothetical protein